MNPSTRRLVALLTATILAGGGIGLGAASASAAGGEVHTVCASGCDYTTIQAAVNAAASGDTVSVAAGTYSEKVTVNKGLTIEGVGSGEDPASATILSGTSGNGFSLSGSYSAPVFVKDIRVTGFANGVVAGSYVTLDGISSSGNTNYGISVSNGASDLTIMDSAFDGNKVGLKLGSTASASNISISGSSFDNNSGQGWYSDKNASSGSSLTNVLIVDTTFNGNGDKGFYTEKLDTATFINVEFSNSGNARASQGAGLDINLKYGDYEGISLSDVMVIDSGTAATPNGSGISISARNDGTYAANAATLSGLEVDGGSINGSVTGLYLGGDIQGDISISEVDLSGNGLAINNQTPVTVNADHNWWGSASPSFATLVQGDVETAPWYANATMTALAMVITEDDPVVTLPAEGEIVITIIEGAEAPRVDVSELMGDAGVFVVEDGLTVTNSDGASVSFPAGTTVTPSELWGTELMILELVPMTSVTTPTGSSADVAMAIKIGADGVSFTLDKAVRILLPGVAGSAVGFIESGATALTPITTQCTADSQSAGNALVAGGDCYINVGDDLVVWTKHFTTFAAYSQGLAATGADSTPLWLVGSGFVFLGAIVLLRRAYRRRELALHS